MVDEWTNKMDEWTNKMDEWIDNFMTTKSTELSVSCIVHVLDVHVHVFLHVNLSLYSML